MTARSSDTWLTVRPHLGSRCSGRGSSWRTPTANGLKPSPARCDARRPPSGGPAGVTGARAWRGCSPMGAPGDRDAPSRSPPLQRAQIVALACLEPVARGLHITHWSRKDLADQAVADGIVPAISPRTVGRILDTVDLQPHRTRYWRTTSLVATFM